MRTPVRTSVRTLVRTPVRTSVRTSVRTPVQTRDCTNWLTKPIGRETAPRMRHHGSLLPSLAALLCGALLAAGCASTGAVPQPFPGAGTARAPATDPTAPEPAGPGDLPVRPAPYGGTPDGYALTGTALALRGVPYQNGGATPEGFDCSGFVQYVFAQHGLSMPRVTKVQYRTGKKVGRKALEPGDLVFFSTIAPGPSHVGISLGGDRFVHAPSEGGVVRIDSLEQEYWRTRFIGARRVG